MTGRRIGLGGVLGAVLCVLWTCASASGDVQRSGDWNRRRTSMIESQIQARGFSDPRVLEAMRKVPRHLFVPEDQREHAYDDRPLPIGHSQTISQPYIVAYMTGALQPAPTDRVLEIGTGSGYQAAILAELVRELYTIEIVEPLATQATKVLADLGYRNVHVRHGNGYLGWPEEAPFDKIMVTAAPDEVPQTLIDQLAVGGIMVIPVGRSDGSDQMLTVLSKTKTGVLSRNTLPVRFVPMVGGPGNR
jgi:protein-L-isoaspartate(D-aspartate) O-methyltransferase